MIIGIGEEIAGLCMLNRVKLFRHTFGMLVLKSQSVRKCLLEREELKHYWYLYKHIEHVCHHEGLHLMSKSHSIAKDFNRDLC